MKSAYAVACIIAVIGVFHSLTIRDGHDWGGDFSMYIHHAKNIVDGIAYADTGYIDNPAHSISPPSYPPAFPYLLSLVYRWRGLDLAAMKLGLIGVFLASLWMIFLTLRRLLNARTAAITVAITGLNPYFWSFKEHILSDIPFLLFTFTSLYFLVRADQSDHFSGHQLLSALLAGVMILIAFETRVIICFPQINGVLDKMTMLIKTIMQSAWAIGRIEGHNRRGMVIKLLPVRIVLYF